MHKNWKTVFNKNYYNTESENPILKEDSHHAEIIDITDGLIVDESVKISPDYDFENHEIFNQKGVMSVFSQVDWSEH